MTVIFIDDDPDDLDLFLEAVRIVDPRHACYRATSGKEGIKLLETLKPDVIFLDINMPGLAGWDLVKLIRSKSGFDDVPVYMLSTSGNASEREMFLRMGASNCLVKPSSFHELCEIFRNVITEKKKP